VKPTTLNLVDSYDVLPSPDGHMISYWTDEGPRDVRHDRWVVISASDRARLLAVDRTGDATLGVMTNWAPDSRGLDYVVTRNGVSNIWRQPLSAGPPVQITHFSVEKIFSFAWSPDGRWLSLGTGVNRSDVVLMSNKP
jgi:hypothetical protein